MKRQPKQQEVKIEHRDGQVSAAGGFFLSRIVPNWNPPAWQEAEYWRKFVEKQPIAAICRDTIANYLNSLDWAIVARDSNQRDELKGQIKHYSRLFERGNVYYWDIDFSSQVEWFVKDLFTLPFGTASELGRLDDNPNGRVVWIRPLDAGTLAPTLNFEYPVVQNAPETAMQPIYLQKEYVSRVYLSPRTELRREGWGYAPPERIWRAIEMMYAGDNYYAQLLLDTPEAGILDLGDMDKTTAEAWVKAATEMFVGISPFKIPVIYEHTTQAKFIPFGKPPSEIMYDSVTMRYAAILAAGYGLTLSDIGMPSSSNGGETLAGTIRMERIGKSSGKAIAKKKFESYANRILPSTLKFTWIDYDDERNISKGRARLATAQAGSIWIANKAFLPSEIRRQIVADGLITVDVPEEIDPNNPEFNQSVNAERINTGNKTAEVGAKTNPSYGGHGEIIPQQVIQRNSALMEVCLSKSAFKSNEVLQSLIANAKKNLSDAELDLWEEYIDAYLIGRAKINTPELKSVIDNTVEIAKKSIAGGWVNEISESMKNAVLAKSLSELVSRSSLKASMQAEEDFISGKTDDLIIEMPSVSLDAQKSENLYGIVLNNLVTEIAKYVVLVSKKALLNGVLEVDPTEFNSENIKISREIGKEVAQNMGAILSSVYSKSVEYMQN